MNVLSVMKNVLLSTAVGLTCLFAQACYTLSGISVDPSVSTFAVRTFDNIAPNAPPTLAVDFTERLKDKVRRETRLTLNGDSPDIEFSGKITDYRVVPVAPKPNEVVSLNRLEIRVRVGLLNNKDEKKSWANERDFSFFAEFSNTTDLLTVQDDLIQTISNQLLEDIFNAAFNDW